DGFFPAHFLGQPFAAAEFLDRFFPAHARQVPRFRCATSSAPAATLKKNHIDTYQPVGMLRS
ncbi:MAG TPA: hypothetical protein PLR76_12155, partial [Hyphomonas sp.]|nr:hypothetical protein [Hyphomonas sp.]